MATLKYCASKTKPLFYEGLWQSTFFDQPERSDSAYKLGQIFYHLSTEEGATPKTSNEAFWGGKTHRPLSEAEEADFLKGLKGEKPSKTES